MEQETVSHSAPDMTLPMSEKRKPSFGAQAGKHFWSNYWSNGPMIGIKKFNRYMYLREVARGGMNLDSVKSYLQHNRSKKDGDDPMQGMVFFDLGVLNFVTPIIRKGKNELRKVDYDITVEAIDPFSLDEKKQFEDKARLAMALKSVISAYGKSYQDMLPEFPEGWKPSSSQELEIFLQANNYKIHDEIKGELSINGDLKWENWAHVRNMMYDDWFDIGAAFCRVYKDHNGRRRIRHVVLERFMCSTPVDESCSNLQYGGEVRYISEAEFRIETAGWYDKETQDKIIDQQASYNSYGRYDHSDTWIGYNYNDAVKRVAVLDFEFITPDRKVWVRSLDKKGKVHYDVRSDDYEQGWYRDPSGKRVFDQERYDQEDKKIKSGEKTLFTDSRASVYGGTWIIGTDWCYNYDLLESDKYVSIGYVGFAPEIMNGVTVSTVEQVLEPATMIQIMHNKGKETYGQGWNGFLKIDHSKLVDVALGKGATKWTPKQVLKFFLEKKVLVHNAEMQGNAGSAFEFMPSGITMEDYSKTLWDSVQQMVAITGIDPRVQAGTNISAESLKVQNEATQGALGFLFHAYGQVYASVGKLLLRFTPEFHNNWNYMRQFVVGAVRMTSAEERAELKARINKYASVPLSEGGLTASDEAMLDNIKDLKLASWVLAYFVKRNMEQAQAAKQKDMQMQGQLNQQAAQVTSQLKLSEINAEAEAEIKVETAKHGFKMEEIGLQNQGKILDRQTQMDGMYQIARQQGSDTIIKESQRANNNLQVTDSKNANDRALMSAEMYHDHSISEREKEHEHEMADRTETHEKAIAATQAKNKTNPQK